MAWGKSKENIIKKEEKIKSDNIKLTDKADFSEKSSAPDNRKGSKLSSMIRTAIVQKEEYDDEDIVEIEEVPEISEDSVKTEKQKPGCDEIPLEDGKTVLKNSEPVKTDKTHLSVKAEVKEILQSVKEEPKLIPPSVKTEVKVTPQSVKAEKKVSTTSVKAEVKAIPSDMSEDEDKTVRRELLELSKTVDDKNKEDKKSENLLAIKNELIAYTENKKKKQFIPGKSQGTLKKLKPEEIFPELNTSPSAILSAFPVKILFFVGIGFLLAFILLFSGMFFQPEKGKIKKQATPIVEVVPTQLIKEGAIPVNKAVLHPPDIKVLPTYPPVPLDENDNPYKNMFKGGKY